MQDRTVTTTAIGGIQERAGSQGLGCLHCGLPTMAGEAFCCTGCERVHELLFKEGLDRYYDLRGQQGVPLAEPRRNDLSWLDTDPMHVSPLTLDVQGIHCAACVWLLERLFVREKGGRSIQTNPALGQLRIVFGPDFSLRHFAETLESFGYKLAPPSKTRHKTQDGLLLTMGISIALSMNAMIFSFAIYAGLREGPLFHLFQNIVFGLGTLSVLVGGPVFFRSAWAGIRNRTLHLDLPIALGIVLAYVSSAIAHFGGRDAVYFDTLTVFVSLMLVGRFLQTRVLEKNRLSILAADGFEKLLTRRVDAEDRVSTVKVCDIIRGDTLVIGHGDLVPVPGALLAPSATLSLDWISGESDPVMATGNEPITAGAFNIGKSAFLLRATEDGAASPLRELLRATHHRDKDVARTTPFWQTLTRIYVAAVLVLGVVGFLCYVRDPLRALDVTAGLLIVTCPCAFGIATPMAYEFVQAGLRRAGLFVRSQSFLDKVIDVREVIFDKTGTLTTGRLSVHASPSLSALSETDRRALYNMVVRSSHPKSAAIARLLPGEGFEPEAKVFEEPGVGLEARLFAHAYRLARKEDSLTFVRDDKPLATFTFEEEERPGAGNEVSRLSALGLSSWIASGDTQEHVDRFAKTLGISHSQARGGMTPRDKRTLIAEHPRALMIGDGINDALAIDGAYVSGTPAVDRPFLPARSDFYFTTPGLSPIVLAVEAARALRSVTRRNLAVAVAYNVLTVSLAFLGLLSPLVCAIVMPISSLTVVLTTTWSLSRGATLWTS